MLYTMHGIIYAPHKPLPQSPINKKGKKKERISRTKETKNP